MSPHSLTFAFRYSNYTVRDLPYDQLPYVNNVVPSLHPEGPYDSTGVIMYEKDGKLYNHPVRQASYALKLLNGYTVTGNTEYLTLAERQAQRLLDKAVSSRGALYFPYPFDFARHSDPNDVMQAPWYSAMAQGQALSAFVRLYQFTKKTEYRTAATLAYNSFKNLRSSSAPWTVFIDSNDFLWFEEYAHDPPDRTLNGHIFAVYGLLDYYRLTGDPDSKKLLQGGIATVRAYIPTYRHANWISSYCLAHPDIRSTKYHVVHTDQLLDLYRITGFLLFAQTADLFANDYPDDRIYGATYFAGGAHTGYSFDRYGNITGSKTATLTRASGAPNSTRRRIIGRDGYWMYITDGVYQGYWLRETPGSLYIPGAVQPLTYAVARRIQFSAGTYTGYRYSANGTITASKRVTLRSASGANTTGRAIINGRLHLYMVDGAWAGYWMPVSSGVALQ